MEIIFPELAGSEDERIRKTLIRYHQSTIDIDGIKGEKIIVWLEKQKPEMITPEESLGISSEEYNKIVDECIFDEQELSKWSEEDERNMGKCKSVVLFTKDGLSLNEKAELKRWLDSLKQRMEVQQ